MFSVLGTFVNVPRLDAKEPPRQGGVELKVVLQVIGGIPGLCLCLWASGKPGTAIQFQKAELVAVPALRLPQLFHHFV
jgi:hypothetical protein